MVITRTAVIRNLYRDSMALMQLSARLAALPKIREAAAIMASSNNRALLSEAGLAVATSEAGPNDILIVIKSEDEAAIEAALVEARHALERKTPSLRPSRERERPRSLQSAAEACPEANLVLISTPGVYATAEAIKALNLGLNVMLFSDNVALEDEIALKHAAQARGLIVMGPDCGTAIIRGIPLGFANVVRRGTIGIVAASGTGLQEVSCLVDRLGQGISQALGTGGRDLSPKVGGATMLQGIEALAADAGTRVIVLISKPPARQIAERVLKSARRSGKPVVVNFLGADPDPVDDPGLVWAQTLEDAALAAVALASGRKPESFASLASLPPPPVAGQRYVRGLFGGGTLCYEASMLLGDYLSPVFSNTPVGGCKRLMDVWNSQAHTLIDLGDDAFTRGRPHPLIDHRLRNERIVREASDPETAVILLDVVLGYGSHQNPAAEIAPVIREAIAGAAHARRNLAIVGFVCGTPADPQNLSRQRQVLRDAGMILTESSAQAARLAARIATTPGR
jgi:FdrA protein